MAHLSEAVGAKPSPAPAVGLGDGSTAKSDAAAVPAWGQAFVEGLQFVARAQLDFWSGYLERAWGVDGRRPMPRSTEENFLLQVEYVHAVLRAHASGWSKLPAPSPGGHDGTSRGRRPRAAETCRLSVLALGDTSVGHSPAPMP